MAENKNTQVATAENTQVSRNKVTDFSLGIFGTSDNFIMANQMAKALSSSTIVPREYQGNVSNCLVAIEQANRRFNTSHVLIKQEKSFLSPGNTRVSIHLMFLLNGILHHRCSQTCT